MDRALVLECATRKKSAMEWFRCANTNASTYMLEIYNRSQLFLSEIV